MASLINDLRFAIRVMLKRPASTLVIVLTLGLGIGLTAMTYSIMHGALRKLPFAGADRLMHLELTTKENRSAAVPQHDLVDWREQQSSFVGLAGYYPGTANLSTSDARPERFTAAFMTANGLDLIDVAPLLGRVFEAGEDVPGAPPVAVLGHGIWQNRFAEDPAVVGRQVMINGESHTVVGVMPRGFRFPENFDLWLPLRLEPSAFERGDGTLMEVYGTLAPGATLSTARAEFATIASRLAEAHPEANEGIGVVIKPYIEEHMGRTRPLFYTMLAGVMGLLFIACANVSNLLLAGAAARAKEIAIRTAMGAERRRVIRQLLSEIFVQSLIGGILGVGLAVFGVRLFNQQISGVDLPYWIDIKVDLPVLLFTFGLVFLASLLSGLLPAWLISRSDVNEILKEESRGSSSLKMSRFSKALVMAEVALSCGLLGVTGLTVKSVVEVDRFDYGFVSEGVWSARLELFEKDYPEVENRRAFYDALLERLLNRPEFEAASLATRLPTLDPGRWYLSIEGREYESRDDHPITRRVLAAPSYFETFGVDVVQGRDFTAQDRADGLPVAIVNRSFAERFFPDENPVGQRIRLGLATSERPLLDVVGVAPDLHIAGLDEDPAGVYLPLAQADARTITIAVRGRGDATALGAAVRTEIAALDPHLPVFAAQSMPDLLAQETWHYGLFARLFTIFGVLALFLAAVGFYGVMAFTMQQRQQEMGIRKALGARGPHLFALVVRQGIWQLAIGVVLGLLLALALSQSLQTILFEVSPFDPIVFALVAAVMVVTGLVAFSVSLAKASRIDPVTMLRYE